MSIEAQRKGPAYEALVTAFASFRKPIHGVADVKTNEVVSSILMQKQEQIQEAIKSFDTVQHMDKPSPKMQEDFARLKDILVRVCILTNNGQQLRDEEKASLQQCMQQYEQFLETYTARLEIPTQQMESIKRNLTIHENLEKFQKGRPTQVYTAEAKGKTAIPDVENVQAFSATLALFSKKQLSPASGSPPQTVSPEKLEESSSSWVRTQLREGRRISPTEEIVINERQKAFLEILQGHGKALQPDTNLLNEGFLSLAKLRAREGNVSALRDFPLLRRVLVKSLAYIRQPGSQATKDEIQVVMNAAREYNQLVDDWEKNLIDATPEQKRDFVQTMSLKDEIGQLEHQEVKETKPAHIEKHHPPRPAVISQKTLRILYEPGTQQLFGKTNFVRYMVKYLLGCKMQEVAETKASTGESPSPFTSDDLEKLGLSKLIRDAEKTEHQRVATFNDLKIVQKDLASRIKVAKGPEKKKLETTLSELEKLDKKLTEQAAKFETFSSFVGKERELSFATKGEQYATLKQSIENAHARLEKVKTEIKKK